APAHLEAFADLAGIAREKADIYAGLTPGGTAIYNADLETSPILADAAGPQGVSFGKAGQVALTSLRQTPSALVATASVDGDSYHIRLSDAGAHFALNALGCLAVARALGLDLALAAQGLGRWQPPAGRGKRETLLLDPATEATAILIDDAFNANPTSLAAALDVLAATQPGPGGRRIAILGDMLELGPDETALHAAIAQHPAVAKTDLIHTVGPRMKALWQALPQGKRGHCAAQADDLGAKAHHLVHPGDVVLVKGSKGSYVSRVVDALRHLGHPLPDDTTGE
ncbi:glutamate ligase domain-containing protein, partial [Pararhodobacter zhoushanensis]|uniref:glutamate ligase domain-containing protein n=1 Tax=Pararhodobacter zhoushanensis TaxID=2479545 RepID=UPI001FE4745F